MSRRTGTEGPAAAVAGEEAAIYCRISHADDDDQTGVDRQERICREVAARLGVRVSADHVFVDNNRSAWRRNRKRPGWDRMLDGMRNSTVSHVIAYHPDRLMRQPRDLEELLQIADDRRITLHGQANRRDLSDANDRFILRIEVAHACRSSDDTSRRLKDAMDDRVRAGSPHTGVRRFGYSPDGRTVIEGEAETVREAFRRYLDGQSPAAIARDLHARGLTTAQGKTWNASRVRDLLDSHHVAGIRVFRGQEAGQGSWPAIIDRGQWDEVRQQRTYRAAQVEEKCRRRRFYLLRGVVMCTCGTRMAGSMGNGGYLYRCSRRERNDAKKCGRTIAAEQTEEFARDVALEVLEKLDVSGRPPVTMTRPDADVEADEDDARQLQELNAMWTAKEVSTKEYREMRRTIEARIKERQRRTVQRPIAVLEGIAGPHARAAWRELEKSEDYARMNAVFRFLFAAVIIHPAKGVGKNFDYDRIEVEPNPLD